MISDIKKPHATEKSNRRKVNQGTGSGWRVRKHNQMEEARSV